MSDTESSSSSSSDESDVQKEEVDLAEIKLQQMRRKVRSIQYIIVYFLLPTMAIAIGPITYHLSLITYHLSLITYHLSLITRMPIGLSSIQLELFLTRLSSLLFSHTHTHTHRRAPSKRRAWAAATSA